MKIFSLIFLLTIFLNPVFAQKNTTQLIPPNKIVFIDGDVFNDKELGIPKLVEAYEKIGIELKVQNNDLKELMDKFNSLREVVVEAEKKSRGIGCYSNEKTDALSKMAEEGILKSAKLRGAQERLYAEHVKPIHDDIKKSLKQFALLNNYELIVDKSTINESFFTVYSSNYIDVTKEFIQFYNKQQ